jgi:hypothetical protein
MVHLGSHNTNPVALIQAAPIDLTAAVGRAGLERNVRRATQPHPGL